MAPRSGISDSSSGSISTSPRSNASSIAFSSFSQSGLYSQHQPVGVAPGYGHQQIYSHHPHYSQPFGVPGMSSRRLSSITDTSQSGMLPPARSPGMGNPVSPSSLSATARDNYTTSTPHINRHGLSPRSHPESITRSFAPMPDTPRSVVTPGGALSLSPPNTLPYGSAGANMLSYPAQHDARQQPESPPFSAQETFHEITSDGQAIAPHIDCKVEKGFFFSNDRTWTCYRRNYFSVNCSYTLNPHLPNGRLYLNRGGRNGPEQIQAMAVTLSAAVDGAAGKSIELVQHTPKRDKGPQLQIQMEKLMPMPPGKGAAETHGYPLQFTHSAQTLAPPFLPLQQDTEQSYSPAGHSATSHQHTFERIQFKSATANNGKRRAQQQYYHLIVELYADVRRQNDTHPEWVRVAQRVSAAVVVRGRSPSHYQHEGPHSASSSRGGGTGSGAGGPGHAAYGGAGAPGSAGRGMGNSLAMLGGTGMGGAVYRGSQYQLDPSPIGSHSVSSASSMSGGPVEGIVGEQAVIEDEDSKAIDQYEGYQYYPSPIAEAGLPIGTKQEYDPAKRVKVEYNETSVPSSFSVGGCGRYQGVDTSRGYFPDLNAGY
ncbi:ndt80 like DNA-binding family protein [Botryosphaeria dothidea]|uniref:Ndt80 like DNA-binding family protein n=1 Tax=Botryosphaeria dothidea TaxID=55169 RepID=A0A8H4J124_9PEZI|nr:ndt80 like DNA-binding family protein [Botryosphaeria dothidea]